MKSQPQILKRLAEAKEALASKEQYMKVLDERKIPHDNGHYQIHLAQAWHWRDVIATLEWVLGNEP